MMKHFLSILNYHLEFLITSLNMKVSIMLKVNWYYLRMGEELRILEPLKSNIQ